jgi:hypothetical protein
MKIIQGSWVLMGIVGVVLIGSTAACENGGTDTSGTGGMGTGGMGTGGMGTGGMGTGGSMVDPQHEQICNLIESNAGMSSGYAVPGVAGAPRWGFPDMPPATNRVRRSWSTLSDAEKKQVVDAFIALKNITVMSGDPGSPRADYTSFCDELGLGGWEDRAA